MKKNKFSYEKLEVYNQDNKVYVDLHDLKNILKRHVGYNFAHWVCDTLGKMIAKRMTKELKNVYLGID